MEFSHEARRGEVQERHDGCLHSNRKREGAWPVRDHDDDCEETQRRDRRFLHAFTNSRTRITGGTRARSATQAGGISLPGIGRFASHGVANRFPPNETTPCGAGGCGRVHRGAKPASGSGWESNPPGDFSDATLGLKPRAVTRSAYTPGKPTVAAGPFDRRGPEETSQTGNATALPRLVQPLFRPRLRLPKDVDRFGLRCDLGHRFGLG